ncbi:MAG TPA: ATP-binding protein [Streptosporangiaceae bacterium]|nr:ATP-binding protein [Streptosporangiaceae bacterium]
MTEPDAEQRRRDHCQVPSNEAWHSHQFRVRHEFPGEVVYSRKFPALPDAASLARRLARMALVSWHLPGEAVETAELLIAEIVSNAVRFGGSLEPKCSEPRCADSVGLILRLHADELIIETSDSNQSPPVLAEPGYEAEYGRGLWLVDQLSKKWGHHNQPWGGKTVYCVVGI